MSEKEAVYRIETTDKDELRLMLDAGAWYSVTWAMDQYLRGITKRGEDEARGVFAQEIRDELWKFLIEYDVRFE